MNTAMNRQFLKTAENSLRSNDPKKIKKKFNLIYFLGLVED